jgi:putative endonuclease
MSTRHHGSYVMLNGVKHLDVESTLISENAMTKQYFVYILANASRRLYVGVTNNLERRVYQHKHKLIPGFTSEYNITRLVHFETVSDVSAAIAREKQIKGWLRSKKLVLIESQNPTREDLSAGWFAE